MHLIIHESHTNLNYTWFNKFSNSYFEWEICNNNDIIEK